jgi:hypothetical protein
MNIRCAFCQTPYTLSRVAMLDALQEMESKKLTHYDAHCPRCKRATQIPRQRMEMFFPNWREALKAFEAEMKQHPQQEAPLPAPEAAPVAETESKPEPVAQAASKPRSRPVAKAEASKSTASSASKTAAKKAPAATTSKGKKTTTKKSK